jgi:predicted metal-dependent enzyme (double-stranded beta helix superfamily)
MDTPRPLDEFVDHCGRLAPSGDHDGIAALLRELVSDPAEFGASVPPLAGEPSARGWQLGGEHVCHRSDDLTVMVLDTLPGVAQPPHEHLMNAIIGVFDGCEEQRFFRRTDEGIAPASGRSLEAGEVMVLGERAIHAISAPEGRTARAIHVYLGDIYRVERSLFHPESLAEFAYTADLYDEFCRPVH